VKLKFRNSNQQPRIMYGMHMEPGVCDYNDPQFTGRILIQDGALKRMNETMACKPWVVKHQDVTDENAKDLADGYVLESFYNTLDGKHWAKFLVISDEGLAAVEKGWALSNCYHPTEYAQGGKWHEVPFDKEVMNGEYEHLACVPNPRYEASLKIGLLTPEEFKAYNAEKERELVRLANAKAALDPPPSNTQENPMAFKLFKRQQVEKIENASDVGSFCVELKGGREVSIQQLVNEADEHAEEKKKEEKENAEAVGKPVMANMEHKVKIGNDEMSVGDLVNKYNEAMANPPAGGKNKPGEQDAAGAAAQAKEERKAAELAAKNSETPEQKKLNAEKAELDKKSNAHFDALLNAPAAAAAAAALQNSVAGVSVYESADTQVQRGIDRYGSKKRA
jgi:hypothetical protein